MQHHLTPGYGKGLASFIFLFNDIVQGSHDIGTLAAAFHGDLGFVKSFNVRYGLGALNFASVQVLDKEALLGSDQRGPSKKFPGQMAFHLDAIFDQFHGKTGYKANAAKLAAGIGPILIGTLQGRTWS
ncbi:hypothetical protein MASR2M78_27480 [Treponema sp.]